MQLAVRSDSISALTALLKFKNVGEGSAKIAREMALDIAGAVYKPSLVSHIPGVTNTLDDYLSRWHEPGKDHILPAALQAASQRQVPARDATYWHTDVPP